LIDLDTLSRRPLWVELGDAWRSWCNRHREHEPIAELDLRIFEASAGGWLDALELGVSRAELETLQRRGAMLKIRFGGERTPSSAAVAGVLSLCAELHLPLKATAGLHHALRSESHGFLNLLLAATLAYHGGSVGELEALLEESDVTALGFEPGSITWRDHRFDVATISDARRLFRSFGSCSFEEPLESLDALRLRSR
jgi:hypothetical protein